VRNCSTPSRDDNISSSMVMRVASNSWELQIVGPASRKKCVLLRSGINNPPLRFGNPFSNVVNREWTDRFFINTTSQLILKPENIITGSSRLLGDFRETSNLQFLSPHQVGLAEIGARHELYYLSLSLYVYRKRTEAPLSLFPPQQVSFSPRRFRKRRGAATGRN